MPIAAIGMIIVGSETVGVVGGLMMASGGLTLAGYATDNEKLKMAGAVTGLVAGGYGLMNSAGALGTAAEIGSAPAVGEAMNAEGIASQAMAPGVESFGTVSGMGADNAGLGAEPFADMTNYDGMNATPAAAPTDVTNTPAAPGVQNPPASPGATPATGNGIVADAMSKPATGGILDMPDTVAGPPQPGSIGWKQLVGDQNADMNYAQKLWEGFKKLDPQTRNAIGQAVAKGLGSVSDFVGPKADLMRAQTGITSAQTDVLKQQLANINTTGIVKSQTYTIQPRAPA